MTRSILAGLLLALTLAVPTLAARPLAPSVDYAPAAPHYGDELTVTVDVGRGVFNVLCYQDGTLVYSGAGNVVDPTITLSSLVWTGGGASCLIHTFAQRDEDGDRYIASTTPLEVLP